VLLMKRGRQMSTDLSWYDEIGVPMNILLIAAFVFAALEALALWKNFACNAHIHCRIKPRGAYDPH
jgi:hypothetical protein